MIEASTKIDICIANTKRKLTTITAYGESWSKSRTPAKVSLVFNAALVNFVNCSTSLIIIINVIVMVL